jgi:hypothetical protein
MLYRFGILLLATLRSNTLISHKLPRTSVQHSRNLSLPYFFRHNSTRLIFPTSTSSDRSISVMQDNSSSATKQSLLGQVRDRIRLKHYSTRTEDNYVQTIKRFILLHRKRHPRDVGVDEIRQYPTHLAVNDRVSASTQNWQLSALLFFYREVLGRDLAFVDGIIRAKRPKRVLFV